MAAERVCNIYIISLSPLILLLLLPLLLLLQVVLLLITVIAVVVPSGQPQLFPAVVTYSD